jgi:hypothetical protein
MTHVTHTISEGESVSSVAHEHGLEPQAVWDDPRNAELRALRQHRDRVRPGDTLYVKRLQLREEPSQTDKRHRFRKKAEREVIIRLDAVEDEPPVKEDRFILEATDGSYRQERTVADDLIPYDQYLDLHYSGLDDRKSYNLLYQPADGGEAELLFENVPYHELAGVSPSVAPDNVEEVTPSPDEKAAYADYGDDEQHDPTYDGPPPPPPPPPYEPPSYEPPPPPQQQQQQQSKAY